MRFHIHHERTPASTTFVHPYPPRSHTRIDLLLTPVSSPLCHPHQPIAVTRINLSLSLVMFLNVTTDRSVRWCLRDGRRGGWVKAEDVAFRFLLHNGTVFFLHTLLYIYEAKFSSGSNKKHRLSRLHGLFWHKLWITQILASQRSPMRTEYPRVVHDSIR